MYIAYNLLFDMFALTPSLVPCFRQKGGENFDDFVFTLTPLLMIDKKGEKEFSLYACFVKKIVYTYMFCFANRRKRFCDFVLCLISMFTPTFAYMFMCLISILYCLFVMHELRGSFFEALL